MKFWPSLWLARMSGFAALVLTCSGCATNLGSCEPAQGQPYLSSPQRAAEYIQLFEGGVAPETRAWIRETDRVIRANRAYVGLEDEE